MTIRCRAPEQTRVPYRERGFDRAANREISAGSMTGSGYRRTSHGPRLFKAQASSSNIMAVTSGVESVR